MEGAPRIEKISDNQPEQELPFDKQLELATKLSTAVDDRNYFIQGQGGFDTFSEAGQYVGDALETYEKMAATVSSIQKEFDEKVSDKTKFVEQLRSMGNNELAERISRMFGLSKGASQGSIFSRIFKK